MHCFARHWQRKFWDFFGTKSGASACTPKPAVFRMVSTLRQRFRVRALAPLLLSSARESIYAIQMRSRTQNKGVADDRRHRHKSVAKLACRENFKLGTGRQHCRFTVLGEEIDTILGRDGRCGISASD